MRFHAQFAHAAASPTMFRLLNRSTPFVVGQRTVPGFSEGQLQMLMGALDGTPNGGTPLCQHIREITEEIRVAAPQLRSNNQRAIVVICTDGEASDGDMTSAIAPLKDLPVHLVIRMCTDDERISSYWNQIDQNLELGMDILDDFRGEAQETHEHSSWLVYGEQLHRLREWGVIVKEFDLLDESKLSSEQMRAICSYM